MDDKEVDKVLFNATVQSFRDYFARPQTSPQNDMLPPKQPIGPPTKEIADTADVLMELRQESNKAIMDLIRANNMSVERTWLDLAEVQVREKYSMSLRDAAWAFGQQRHRQGLIAGPAAEMVPLSVREAAAVLLQLQEERRRVIARERGVAGSGAAEMGAEEEGRAE